jgi:hypothetical protein
MTSVTTMATWIADTHRDDGKRYVGHADEKLTAFMELESAIHPAERPEDCGAHKIKLDKWSPIMYKLPRLRHPTFQLIFGTAE